MNSRDPLPIALRIACGLPPIQSLRSPALVVDPSAVVAWARMSQLTGLCTGIFLANSDGSAPRVAGRLRPMTLRQLIELSNACLPA